MNKAAKQLTPFLEMLRKYSVIIIAVVIGVIYAYIILTSSRLANIEPTDKQIQEAYKPTKKIKVEDHIADKLHELEDNSVQFNSLLNEARENPFTE